MDDTEIKLRCVEAAARNPYPHPDGLVAGVRAAAQEWFEWIKAAPSKGTLGLPKKLV